jgi:Ca-activated chloride channel homolog
MKLVTILIVFALAIVDPVTIGKINTAKSEARKAYASGDYKGAVQKYRYLTDSLNVQEDEVRLNLANAYFQTNDTTNALSGYSSLTASAKSDIRSKAQQQLGIMNHRQGKLEEALENFKQAIKADANNKDARYNYEMLKKKLEEQKKKQEQDQKDRDKDNKDQQQKDKQQNKDQKDQQKKEQENKDQQKKEQEKKDQQEKEQQEKDKQEQEKKDQEQKEKQDAEKDQDKDKNEKKDMSPQLSEKLQQMKMSEEKAKMILEAMKNQEIQYLQQNKRKATKPRSKDKPDW